MERLTMTVPEMAQQLGISRPKAYELANSRKFPSIRVGRRLIIPVASFEQWLRDSAKKA